MASRGSQLTLDCHESQKSVLLLPTLDNTGAIVGLMVKTDQLTMTAVKIPMPVNISGAIPSMTNSADGSSLIVVRM